MRYILSDHRLEARRTAHFDRHIDDGRADSARGEEKGVGPQSCEFGLPACGHGMIDRQRDDHLLPDQNLDIEPRFVSGARVQECRVDLSVTQGVGKPRTIGFEKSHRNIGENPSLGADRRRYERIENGRAGEADRDPPDLPAQGPACIPGGAFRQFGNSADTFEKGHARRREFDAMGEAAEQGRPDLTLQILDLLAQSRLSDAEPRRGARDVPFLGDREKVADMAQFQE